jgi:hypothetical protein
MLLSNVTVIAMTLLVACLRQGATIEAIVEFENESAAKTALLLTNALIEDRPITVTPYDPLVERAQQAADQAEIASAAAQSVAAESQHASGEAARVENGEDIPTHDHQVCT